MAEAPKGAAGAPRQNDTVKEFKGMNTQNRRNAIPKGSFAWLENIQPIGPGNLHSIPGRGSSIVKIPAEPTVCFPNPQELTEVFVFDFDGSIAANRSTWSYVAPHVGGEIIYEATTNYPFDPNRQMWKYTNGVLTEITPLPSNLPAFFSNLVLGHADQSILAQSSDGGSYLYYVDSNIVVAPERPDRSYSDIANMWTVHGDLFTSGQNDSPVGDAIWQNNAITGTFLRRITWAPFNTKPVVNIVDNGNFIYVLYFDKTIPPGSPPYPYFVAKLNRTTLATIDVFALTGEGFIAIEPQSDDLIYYVNQGDGAGPSHVGIGYIKKWSTGTPSQVILDNHVNIVGHDQFGFANNLFARTTGDITYLYYSGEIGAFGEPWISKIGPINC